ncbi:FAD-binding domain-containing protein [Rhodovarius sp.]|uniref:FAD-binding domain-containing protein n=1 Tax=Rhodovarius sp. TaxID=2972673 RepID=UPI0034A555C5
MSNIPPTRAAALAHLEAFAPRMGRLYAAGRNTDPGPGQRQDVSELSAHIRHRLITEEEVVRLALAHHGAEAAEKFIQEVFWRSYWKGFLELRPSMWRHFESKVAADQARLATDALLRGRHEMAMMGLTGIECFNAWVHELKETGYLHNHVRMWFAGIWIFTLKLPWALGADFFLHHLKDADPASNTLSWRWVAGIQTPGKHYVVRPENIERYTNDRFNPEGELDVCCEPLNEPPPPPPGSLPPADAARGRVALLLHSDDVTFWPERCEVVALAGLSVARPCADGAANFAEAALEDGLAMAEARLGTPAARLTPGSLAAWAMAQDVDAIVTPWAPVGWVADALAVAASGVPLLRARRAWDSTCWPLARAGFFPFKDKIPTILQELSIAPDALPLFGR